MNRITNALDRLNAVPSWLKATMLFAIAALCAVALPHDLVAQHSSNALTGLGVGISVIGSTLTATSPTLLDLAKRTDPDGKIADIVEILVQTNEINDDMGWEEGNLTTGHRHTIRTGIPDPTFRKLYQGVQPSKSTTVQVTDDCAMLENYSRVDKALADLGGNAAAYRLSEDKAIIAGMMNKVASKLFYGNSKSTPEEFMGLAPRFSSVSTSTAESADNVIDHGGTGSDNTSIWLVGWGRQAGAFGIVPKGSKAGLQQTDKGVMTVQNSDGSMWEAYVTHYRWDVGLAVRDWTYIVRICNIDVSDLATVANTKALVTSMIKATEHIPNLNAGRFAFYANRLVRESLRLGMLEKIGNNLSWDTVAGKRVMQFDGIPVRRCDALLNTEARIV